MGDTQSQGRKALVLSGGGSKGAFSAGMCHYLLRDQAMEFDLAIGTSTGSMICGPAVLGDYSYVSNLYQTVDNQEILHNSGLGNFLAAIFKIFNSGGSFPPVQASLDPLKKILEEYYLKRKKLKQIIAEGKEAVVVTTSVRTGEAIYVSTNDVRDGKIDPEAFIEATISSASQPNFMVPGQPFTRVTDKEVTPYPQGLFYDGGVRQDIALKEAVYRGATEVWGLGDDPPFPNTTKWGEGPYDEGMNILQVTGWAFGNLVEGVAESNRFEGATFGAWWKVREQIAARAKKMGLSEEQIKELLTFDDPSTFPLTGPGAELRLMLPNPGEIVGDALDFDPSVMSKWFDIGINHARDFVEKKGAPLYTWEPINRAW